MSEEIALARAVGETADPRQTITHLQRTLANTDAALRTAMAAEQAAVADNAVMLRLLGITNPSTHPGAQLLADYERLKRIEYAAAEYIQFGGADRWLVLKYALNADVRS